MKFTSNIGTLQRCSSVPPTTILPSSRTRARPHMDSQRATSNTIASEYAQLECGRDSSRHNGHHGSSAVSVHGRSSLAASLLAGLPALSVDLLPKKCSVVYFLRSAGLVKLGVSRNARGRIIGLRNENASQADLVGFGPGNVTFEGVLHDELLKLGSHHHGEWFTPTVELVEMIAATNFRPRVWAAMGPSKDAHRQRRVMLATKVRRLKAVAP